MLLSLAVFLLLLTFLSIVLVKGWWRNIFEPVGQAVMFCSALIAVFVTLGIFLTVIYETILFFDKIPPQDFFFSLKWSPQVSVQEDNSISQGSFGVIPVLWGTFYMAFIALLFATPIGVMTAIYLSEYASRKVRMWGKPFIELLSGIPTVVYGFLAVILIGPSIRDISNALGFQASSESALSAGLVIGVMIIPMVCSLSDEALQGVPKSLREGALSLGSTEGEMIRKVLVPAALPGIFSGILLAVSRAIGETMIVVMAAGLMANLSLNPLESMTTASVQIVTLLVGDQEFDSAKTLSAYALGATLFLTTLVLNVIAIRIVYKYKETYA